MNVRLNSITAVPSWLTPVVFTRTMPTCGRSYTSPTVKSSNPRPFHPGLIAIALPRSFRAPPADRLAVDAELAKNRVRVLAERRHVAHRRVDARHAHGRRQRAQRPGG